jgi:hypothetical protein
MRRQEKLRQPLAEQEPQRLLVSRAASRHAEARRVAEHRLRKVAPCLPLEELAHPALDMSRFAGDGDHRLALGIERRRRKAPDARPVHDAVIDAAEWDHRPMGEAHPARDLGDAGRDPAAMRVGEAPGGVEIGARRQGQDDLAGRARDPQGDPPSRGAPLQRHAEPLPGVVHVEVGRIGGASEKGESHRPPILQPSWKLVSGAQCHLARISFCA